MLNNLKDINPDKFKEDGNKDAAELFFVTKDTQTKDCNFKYKYNAYAPSISKDVQEKMLKITKERLSKVIADGCDQYEYNPAGQIDGVVEICNKNFVKNMDDVIASSLPRSFAMTPGGS